MKTFGLLLLVAAMPVVAQTGPADLRDDMRFQQTSSRESPIPLATIPGETLTIMFPPRERIVEVALEDTQAFQVSVASSGNSLWVLPQRVTAGSSMTVRTESHAYTFKLATNMGGGVPQVVRIGELAASLVRPGPAPVPTERAGANRYKVVGEPALRPSRIEDDGVHTFLWWDEEQALPAVFAVNDFGKEELINGYMREGAFVVDRVHRKLVFRIDGQTAQATRLPGGSK